MKIVSENPTNVVPLFRRAKDQPGENSGYCSHGGTMLIDSDTRLVKCGLCDRWLDAFTALAVLTREWDRHLENTKWAKYEHERLRERISELRRLESNTKSRLRNARKRLDQANSKLKPGDAK